MVRPLAMIQAGEHFWSIPLSIGLFVSATILVALCANHARKKVSRKHNNIITKPSDPHIAPRSPMKLMTTISNKAVPFMNNKKNGDDHHQEYGEATNESKNDHHEGFGEGGLWQKAILMGEKCQPPEFSGVIYYDYRGNRVSELPRSPRTPRAVARDLNY